MSTQKKKTTGSESDIRFSDSVRTRVLDGFRRVYKVLDDHRGAVDFAVEGFGIAFDVTAAIFAFDPTGVSLIIELLKLVWDLSGDPRVRAAVTATAAWVRGHLRRLGAAGHRGAVATAAVVRAGIRRARRAHTGLWRHLRRVLHRNARRLTHRR
ncbi:hypothetical protein ACWEKT_37490 [Nocardia takedensis]